MVDIQKYNITNDTTAGLDAISSTIKLNVTEEFNCSVCTNELCFEDLNYQLYEEWISVNNFETVRIILHTIQILTGILGNLLVSRCQFFLLLNVFVMACDMFMALTVNLSLLFLQQLREMYESYV